MKITRNKDCEFWKQVNIDKTVVQLLRCSTWIFLNSNRETITIVIPVKKINPSIKYLEV